jgi:Protein of unknown function (DUF2911)
MAFLRLSVFLVLALTALNGQRSKYTSPSAEASLVLGGKNITVKYYSPSMHGRKVMGGLVPYGEVWCTGANWATKLSTETDLQMGGLTLPKGSYSIWTIPNEKEWTLIINRETGQFHLNYDKAQDLGRTKMVVKAVPTPIEAFKVELTSTGNKSGQVKLAWENTEASVDFTLK